MKKLLVLLAISSIFSGSVMSMNTEPEELLAMQLSLLPMHDLNKAKLVCTQWKILASDPLLWNKFQEISLKVTATDATLGQLAQRLPSLTSLDVAGCTQISDVGLRAISACTGIKAINLSRCHGVSDDGLQVLTSQCSLLEVLNLNQLAQEIDFAGVFENLISLVEIHLNECLLTDDHLKAFGERGGGLQVISLQQCVDLTDEGIASLIPVYRHDRRLAVSGCPALRSVDLAGCDDISSACIARLAQGCKFLEAVVQPDGTVLDADALELLRNN